MARKQSSWYMKALFCLIYLSQNCNCIFCIKTRVAFGSAGVSYENAAIGKLNLAFKVFGATLKTAKE